MKANNDMDLPREIIIASSNKGKVQEIKAILAGLPIELLSLNDYPAIKLPPETGTTFAENALIKAQSVFEQCQKTVLADDSGLCVDFLNGEPGVHSARFAGDNATDSENNEKMLNLLQDVPNNKRTAQFVCCLCLYMGAANIKYFRGTIEGFIAKGNMGANGFGYDPIFYIDEYKMTMAQLGKKKNEISHRKEALNILSAYLTSLPF